MALTGLGRNDIQDIIYNKKNVNIPINQNFRNFHRSIKTNMLFETILTQFNIIFTYQL